VIVNQPINQSIAEVLEKDVLSYLTRRHRMSERVDVVFVKLILIILFVLLVGKSEADYFVLIVTDNHSLGPIVVGYVRSSLALTGQVPSPLVDHCTDGDRNGAFQLAAFFAEFDTYLPEIKRIESSGVGTKQCASSFTTR
jgi:hypothetical protein